MRARQLVPAAFAALILAETGCGNKEPAAPPRPEKAYLQGKIGKLILRKLPLDLSFAPSSPFVRVPLLLARASRPDGFRLQARLPLRGIRKLRQVEGREWTLEEGLLLTLPGEKEPRTLAEAKVQVKILEPSPDRPLVHCLLKGSLFAPSGKEEPFHLVMEGPLDLLDGQFHSGK